MSKTFSKVKAIPSQEHLLMFTCFLITSKPVSKYNLRSSSDGTLLSFPNIKSKATLGERAFVFAAPKLWNALPRFIRETNSIDSFKKDS